VASEQFCYGVTVLTQPCYDLFAGVVLAQWPWPISAPMWSATAF